MSNELKTCPKCNSRAIDFMRDRNGMWHVKCFRCGFTHVACLSMRQAVETWNKALRVKKKDNEAGQG